MNEQVPSFGKCPACGYPITEKPEWYPIAGVWWVECSGPEKHGLEKRPCCGGKKCDDSENSNEQ